MDILNRIMVGSVAKRQIIPSMLLCVRIALLISITISLLFDVKYLFGVLFVVVIILDVCDVILAMRNTENLSTLGIISNINARLLYIIPLLFLTIHKSLSIWIFLILLFFEIVIGLYKTFANTTGKKQLTFDILYCIYSLAIWLAIFVNIFLHKYGNTIIFVSSAVGAVFIIFSSVIIGDDSGQVDDLEIESDIERTITSEENDEILE